MTPELLTQDLLKKGYIVAFTDGSCIGNPGKGGIGILLMFQVGEKIAKKEIKKGFKLTTNNRMELLAIIETFKSIKDNSKKIAIFSDSRYAVDALNNSWAVAWEKNNWKKSDGKKAQNIDLWEELLDLQKTLNAEFHWVKAHDNNPQNERVDALAKEATTGQLEMDKNYENAASNLF